MFLGLYKTTVRSHLEYTNQVWFPHDLDRTEKMQKLAVKLVTCGKICPMSNALDHLNFQTHSISK